MSSRVVPSRLLRLLIVAVVLIAIYGLADVVGGSRERVATVPATPPAATALATPSPPLSAVARSTISRVITVEALLPGSESLGTAWLLDDRGDFVTNAHVVAGQLGVRLRDRDGHTHFASILGVDGSQDVAVMRSADGFKGSPLAIAAPGTLRPPQGVVIIASGRATGKSEITEESLSRIGADIPVENNPDLDPGNPQTTKVYHDMLQLDGARVFQGNSGGPVLDGSGRVIGILTLASRSGDQAFAVPIWRVLDELRTWSSH